MPHQDKCSGIAFGASNHRNGGIQLRIVFRNVAELSQSLALAAGTAILMQVDGIEGIARGIHLLRQLALEKVIVEPVDVQDGGLRYAGLPRRSAVGTCSGSGLIHRDKRIMHQRGMVSRSDTCIEAADGKRFPEQGIGQPFAFFRKQGHDKDKNDGAPKFHNSVI